MGSGSECNVGGSDIILETRVSSPVGVGGLEQCGIGSIGEGESGLGEWTVDGLEERWVDLVGAGELELEEGADTLNASQVALSCPNI